MTDQLEMPTRTPQIRVGKNQSDKVRGAILRLRHRGWKVYARGQHHHAIWYALSGARRHYPAPKVLSSRELIRFEAGVAS